MEPLELGKFIVQIIQKLGKLLLPFIVCKKGYGVIKCRFGHPIKWRNKARVYWKWPIIDNFDQVDMRKRYIQLNAHSFHSPQMKRQAVPYNLIIDVQVEYNVINPLIIYDKYGFKEDEEPSCSYVNNTVQLILSDIIEQHGIKLDYNTLVSEIRKKQKKYKREQLSRAEIKAFDNTCLEFYRQHLKVPPKDTKIEESISISNILVTSFDKNISLRTTI